MKNKRVISVLMILLCLSLCIGVTYAYFTDSATSSGNKIQAGKLKIDLELLNKDTLIWNSIKGSQDPIFYYEYWEPGYTDVKLLRVENEETLAIKWEARFIYEGEFPALADAIEVYVKTSENEFAYPTSRDLDDSWEYQGTLAEFASNISNILNGKLLSGESDYFGIALYMPTDVDDNDLQGEAIGPFDIQIIATQLANESDAFDEKYDENAEFPCEHKQTITVPGYAADCQNTGLTDGIKCADCEAVIVEQEEIPFAEHTEVIDAAVDPTCTQPGLTQGIHCSACQETIVEQETIPATGNHTESDWMIDTPAGEGIEGSQHTECTVCHETIQSEIIPALPISIFTFADNGDGTYTVTGFKEGVTVPENLEIPSSHNGSPVTAIGNSSFGDNLTIKSVTIPDSVTTIGESAFANCTLMTSITLSNNLISVGNHAFSYCENLTIVTIPDSVTTMGESAFARCTEITSITLSNNLTGLSNGLFTACISLTSITIPNSVKSIGTNVFLFASDLEEIKFNGTIEQWQSIEFGSRWNKGISATEVICTDGTVAL